MHGASRNLTPPYWCHQTATAHAWIAPHSTAMTHTSRPACTLPMPHPAPHRYPHPLCTPYLAPLPMPPAWPPRAVRFLPGLSCAAAVQPAPHTSDTLWRWHVHRGPCLSHQGNHARALNSTTSRLPKCEAPASHILQDCGKQDFS